MAERTEKKPKYVSDWANRPARPESTLSEQRQRIWQALSEFVTSNGGWVTSLGGKFPLRFEIPRKDSTLVSRLIDFGYSLRHAGIGTRITPPGIVPIDVIEITLGE